MEFGRVDENELEHIDFVLPSEPVLNAAILDGQRRERPKIYIGCAKWGREEWIGKIYPPKTKERNFLDHYVQHFNSIELNATHYKIFGPLATKKWAAKAGDRDFLFCPKMFQGVTHRGKLKGKNFLLNEFLRGVRGFDRHLGPVLVQLNETFSPKRKDELFEFLNILPNDLQFFLEVRHPDWFRNPGSRDILLNRLRDLKIGFVITDSAGRRDAAHMHLTVPKVFIRFVGNSLHRTDYIRIDDWVRRIEYWLDRGLNEVYFFMHMHDEATSPELTAYLVERMNEVCHLTLEKPKFMTR